MVWIVYLLFFSFMAINGVSVCHSHKLKCKYVPLVLGEGLTKSGLLYKGNGSPSDCLDMTVRYFEYSVSCIVIKGSRTQCGSVSNFKFIIRFVNTTYRCLCFQIPDWSNFQSRGSQSITIADDHVPQWKR